MRRRFRVIEGRHSADAQRTGREEPEFPSFEVAVQTHLDGLFSFALRLSRGRWAEAEDLVQEACLRAYKGYKGLRSPRKVKAWFFRILVNTHASRLEKDEREVPMIDVELAEDLLESTAVYQPMTPEETFFENLLDGDIQEALDALPVEFRTVVWLYDVEDLSYKEIGEVVGCPPGTVASRLYRGRGLLRERLREYASRHGLTKE